MKKQQSNVFCKDLEQLLEDRRSGMLYVDIAEKYDCSVPTVQKYCKDGGVKFPIGMTPEQVVTRKMVAERARKERNSRANFTYDEQGQKINLGMSERQWKMHLKEKKQRELKKMQEYLLTW